MRNILASIKRRFAIPLMWIRGFFFIFGKIPFLLLLIVIAIFSFVINDQGMDLMFAFYKLGLFHPYVVSFVTLLFIWASVLWYVTRIILTSANLKRVVDKEVPLSSGLVNPASSAQCELKEDYMVVLIDDRYRRSIQTLSKYLPRIMAALPYLIFILGYLKVNGVSGSSFIQVLIVFFLGATHVLYLCYRTDIFKNKKIQLAHPDDRFVIQEVRDPRLVIKTQHLRNTTRFLIPTAFFGSFIYAWANAITTPSLEGKPGLIILCGLIFYSLIGLFTDYVSNWLRFPFFLSLVIVMLFVSLPRNNNHALKEVGDEASMTSMIKNRLSDSLFAANWLNEKWQRQLLDTSKDGSIPVYIVAAEGGGIRACYWTVQVLKQLHIKYPGIYDNTFAVTGASGGTVGLSFFYNYIYQKKTDDFNQLQNLLQDEKFYGTLDTIAGADYLTGVTFGFMFPDLIQRAIPFPIKSFDRAKFLNNDFSKAFSTYIANGKPTVMDEPIIGVWQRPDYYNYPVILYNSLFVEQGQKAIFSPFRLSEKYFRDVLDIFDTTGVMVPVNEGMVSSARFPIITPPGLMKRKNDKKIGHLVDGGYFENTAMQTAQQIAILVKKISQQLNLSGRKVKPVIISLRYGSGTKELGKALGWNYEAAPVKGGINTLFRWFDAAHAISINLDEGLNSINFRLPKNKGDNIPLGWYLSDSSRALIKKYAQPQNIGESIKALERYLVP